MDFIYWYVKENNRKTDIFSGFTNKIYKEHDLVFKEAVEKCVLSDPAVVPILIMIHPLWLLSYPLYVQPLSSPVFKATLI